MPTRYYLSLPDPSRARGSDARTAFTAHGAEEFAVQLEDALRSPALFERWRGAQEDPDAVDEGLGVTDPSATVTGDQHATRVDLVATTSLPGNVVRHRLRMLAGSGWELRDVTSV